MSEDNGTEAAPTGVVATESVISQKGMTAIASTPTPTVVQTPVAVDCESPPPAAMPERLDEDPRARLLELAATLMRSKNRRLVVEYLRLRRAIA